MALTTYKIIRVLSNADVLHDDLEKGERTTIDAYIEVGAVNAHSTEHALRQAGEKHGSGEFVAVSTRSWKQEKVTVETTPRVRIGS